MWKCLPWLIGLCKTVLRLTRVKWVFSRKFVDLYSIWDIWACRLIRKWRIHETQVSSSILSNDRRYSCSSPVINCVKELLNFIYPLVQNDWLLSTDTMGVLQPDTLFNLYTGVSDSDLHVCTAMRFARLYCDAIFWEIVLMESHWIEIKLHFPFFLWLNIR